MSASTHHSTAFLRHGRVRLALHTLRPGGDGGHPLLLLHGLAERTPATPPEFTASWPGPVLGLDFTGHGESDVPVGGGYTAEILMGDVDAALARVGPSTVVGFGLGAWVALLIAGARTRLVRGAVLAEGPGMAGGGTAPTSMAVLGPAEASSEGAAPDPFALVELTHDVRPQDYATSFAHLALQGSEVATPLVVCARWQPPWLQAVVDEPGVVEVDDLAEALALLR